MNSLSLDPRVDESVGMIVRDIRSKPILMVNMYASFQPIKDITDDIVERLTEEMSKIGVEDNGELSEEQASPEIKKPYEEEITPEVLQEPPIADEEEELVSEDEIEEEEPPSTVQEVESSIQSDSSLRIPLARKGEITFPTEEQIPGISISAITTHKLQPPKEGAIVGSRIQLLTQTIDINKIITRLTSDPWPIYRIILSSKEISKAVINSKEYTNYKIFELQKLAKELGIGSTGSLSTLANRILTYLQTKGGKETISKFIDKVK